jgi:DNA processing protein
MARGSHWVPFIASDETRTIERTFAETMTTLQETAAIVALMRQPGVPAGAVADLVQDYGSATAALQHVMSGGSADQALQLFSPDPVDAVTPPDLEGIQEEIRTWQASGIALTTVLDAEYPENLHTVHNRPPLLFVRGTLRESDERSVAIVGTRKASSEGLGQARAIATSMVDAGYVVVSGLAAGVDTAAHRAALDAGGRTVAVIGTGLDHVFPKGNAGLQREIGETHAVVSHLWPDQGPRPWTFPARNAVMSGLARATVVIEASHTSGARMQARLALEHGRPVFLLRSLLVHPWARTHAERPGAHVIDRADEVVEILDREYSVDVALTG